MGLQDEAIAYARGGIAVFPCLPSKAPATDNGFKDATRDVGTITDWWRRREDALIGAVVPDGIVIIDIDPRNGGDVAFKQLQDDGVRFPRTKTARTGSGGTHRWYTIPLGYEGEHESGAVRLRSTAADGVDVKRPGKGYVILPPSVSDAGAYVWTDRRDVVPLPPETLEFLTVRAKKRDADFTPTHLAPWEQATAYAEVAMKHELAELAQAKPGERNDALNRAAFNLYQLVHGGEVREEVVTEALEAVAVVDLGLTPTEVERTLGSALEGSVASPRSAPLETPTPAAKVAQIGPDRHEEAFWTRWDVDEPDAPPYYLEPILPQNAYVLVYGATEAAKSMTWNALLAQGSHHGVKSSVYSLENPPHVDRSRLRRLAPDPECFRITHQPLDVSDYAQVETMIERERAWGTDVILLDTYSHAFSSRSDDGNAKAIEFARRVRHIMEQVKCSVVVIDHTGYTQREEPRDASAKRQQVDVAILMERDGSWVRGQPARFKMTNFKAARFGNPFEDVRGSIWDTDEGGLELRWFDADFASRWQAR